MFKAFSCSGLKVLCVLAILMLVPMESFAKLGTLKKKVNLPIKKKKAKPTVKSTKNSDECNRYANSAQKMDDKIQLRLSEKKPKSAEMSLQSYNNYITKMKNAGCFDVARYETRAQELADLISQGHGDANCSQITEKIRKQEARIVELIGRVRAGFEFSTLNEIGYYLDFVKEGKADGCIQDDSDYQAKAQTWQEQTKAAAIKSDPFKYFCKGLEEEDMALMEAAFANGLEVNGFYTHERTPLMAAAESGKKANVAFVLSKNPDINLVNKQKKVALDYESNSRKLTPEDIEIKLLLLDKGADGSLANLHRMAINLAKNKQFEEFKKIEAYTSTKYSAYDYACCYWEAPNDNEMCSYFAKKSIAQKIGKTYSDFKSGMKNASLQSKMLGVANKVPGGYRYTKLKILSDQWVIVRNELTGNITHREIYTYAYGKTKHGIAYVDQLCFLQPYDGSKYSPLQFARLVNKRTVDSN